MLSSVYLVNSEKLIGTAQYRSVLLGTERCLWVSVKYWLIGIENYPRGEYLELKGVGDYPRGEYLKLKGVENYQWPL